MSPAGADSPVGSPEATLDQYMMGIRAGSLAQVRSAYFPPDMDFYLPGPLNIVSWGIVDKRILTAEEAAKYTFRPKVLAGDVKLNVQKVLYINGEERRDMASYWLRNIDGQWKIYSHSVWGAP